MGGHSPHLSLREIEVLRLAAEGHTAKGTAQLLHLSESAVNLYLMHARQKMNAKTKAEAIAMLIDTGSVVRDSLGHVIKTQTKAASPPNQTLDEMVLLSNRLRHLLDDMLLADAAQKARQCDFEVWNALAEKLLKLAAQACGYEVVRAPRQPAPENA